VKANSKDNPRYHETIKGPDAEGFWGAMQIDYDQLQKRRFGFLLEKMNIMSLGQLGYTR